MAAIATGGGCGTLLGIDDYAVGEEAATAAGAGGSGGTAVGGTSSISAGGGISSGGSQGGGASLGGAAGMPGSVSDGGAGGSSTATGGAGSGGTGMEGTDVGGTDMGGSSGAAGSSGGVECLANSDCQDRNECTVNVCEEGVCIQTPAALGAACAAGVCDGAEHCVHCVDDQSGSEQDVGCPAQAPDCDETGAVVQCTGCQSDGDCDDGRECTGEACIDGRCTNPVALPGSSCSAGVCNGQGQVDSCVPCINDSVDAVDSGCSNAAPLCDSAQSPAVCVECAIDADCDDDNECTGDSCVQGACQGSTLPAGTSCASGLCNGRPGQESCGACIDDASGGELDAGCAAGAPVCNVAVEPASCTGCVEDVDCDDGLDCTVDVCSESACQHQADDGLCPQSGDACMPYECLLATGCQQVSRSVVAPAFSDGNLDGDLTPWVDESSQGYEIFYLESAAPVNAHSPPRLAWLGGIEDELSELYRVVSLPAGAQILHVRFRYHIVSTANNSALDTAGVTLRSATGTSQLLTQPLVEWTGADENSDWASFSADVDVDASWGSQIQLYFWGANGSRNGPENLTETNFFIDSIELDITVCD